jgi:periplasmic divalent cation tolerance protein
VTERCVQITTTVSSTEAAQRLADGLVEAGLAACVQVVGPLSSTYRWRDDVERAEEWMCIIKTAGARAGRVQEWIATRHEYEVPEITVVPIVGGSEAYLAWIEETT